MFRDSRELIQCFMLTIDACREVGMGQFKCKLSSNIYGKIFQITLYIFYMTYMVMTQHKNLSPGVMKFTIFGRPFLGHHYYKLSMSDLCLRVEKKTFEEILHFHNMTYKSTPQHKNPAPGSSKRQDHERQNWPCSFF